MIDYSWEKDGTTITGYTSATYLPSTATVSVTDYTATVTANSNFESVPTGILPQMQTSDTAVITVSATATTPTTPPASSSTTPTVSSSSSTVVTPTPTTPTDTSDPEEDSEEVSSSSSSSPQPASSSSSSSNLVTSSSVSGTTTQPEDDRKPQITPGGGITLPPGGSGGTPGNVTIDGAPLDSSNVSVDGNGNLTISPEYFATLPDGEYTLTVTYDGVEYESSIIVEDGVPTSAGILNQVRGWSLFNLIVTILTMISPVIFLVTQGKKKSKNSVYKQSYKRQQEEIYTRRNATAVAGFILFAVTFIILILTQDFSYPMVIFDIYSIWFAIIFVVQTIVEVVFRRKNVTNRPNFVSTTEIDITEINNSVLA